LTLDIHLKTEHWQIDNHPWPRISMVREQISFIQRGNQNENTTKNSGQDL